MTDPDTIWRAGRRLVVGACLLAMLLIPAAGATPGGLDPSFGSGGKVTTSFGPGYDAAFALALQPDGKPIVGGYSDSGSDNDFAVARYNPDGTLDTTFNGTGKATTDISSGDDEVLGLVLQPDGKVVAAGDSAIGSEWDFSLARYNADGTLDTTFNGTGKVTTWFGPSSGANALALQPDGKIVAAGSRWDGMKWDFALTRYNPDGTLDTNFNGTGKVTTTISSGIDSVYAIVVQPDGKLVVAGYSGNSGSEILTLARYNADGTLDTNFNGTGKVTTAIGSSSRAAALILQPNGKLVAAGSTGTGSSSDFAVARFNSDGTLDTSFNGTGIVTTAVGSGQDAAYALVLRPDGRLVAAGVSYTGSQELFTVVRYLPNGSLDSGFNGTGKVVTAFGSSRDVANAVALQPNGEPVAAGYSFRGGSDEDFALARYLDSSSLTVSKSGGGSGSVTSNPNGINCGSTCLASFAGGSVTLTATPSPGSSFLGWSGACSGPGSCTVAVGSDLTVTARFELDQTLTLTKAGNGLGDVTSGSGVISCGTTCTHTFQHGAVVTLTAAAAARSVFTGWSGACSGTATCTVAMSAARSITATFTALCVAPNVKGKTLLAAKRALTKAHCAVGKVTKAFSAKVRKGRVISERPKAGTKLAPGSKLRLSLSKGKRP